jgi:hypothetical protein
MKELPGPGSSIDRRRFMELPRDAFQSGKKDDDRESGHFPGTGEHEAVKGEGRLVHSEQIVWFGEDPQTLHHDIEKSACRSREYPEKYTSYYGKGNNHGNIKDDLEKSIAYTNFIQQKRDSQRDRKGKNKIGNCIKALVLDRFVEEGIMENGLDISVEENKMMRFKYIIFDVGHAQIKS